MYLKLAPVTADRWADLTKVMGCCENAKKCWCAYWFRSNAEYRDGWGEDNRAFLKNCVDSGEVPGLIGYLNKTPIAWVCVAPRDRFERLNRSSTFEELDCAPVWAITCFLVLPHYRQRGVLPKLIRGATEYAFANGAPGVEAYPVVGVNTFTDAEMSVGTLNAFERAGFVQVGQPTSHRRIVRLMQGETAIMAGRAVA